MFSIALAGAGDGDVIEIESSGAGLFGHLAREGVETEASGLVVLELLWVDLESLLHEHVAVELTFKALSIQGHKRDAHHSTRAFAYPTFKGYLRGEVSIESIY